MRQTVFRQWCKKLISQQLQQLAASAKIHDVTSPLDSQWSAANFLQLFLQSRNVAVIAISPEIAELSVSFGSNTNNDPADRIIAATAIIQQAQLVTADRNLLNSWLVGMVWWW